jgi:hypothetical protein
LLAVMNVQVTKEEVGGNDKYIQIEQLKKDVEHITPIEKVAGLNNFINESGSINTASALLPDHDGNNNVQKKNIALNQSSQFQNSESAL